MSKDGKIVLLTVSILLMIGVVMIYSSSAMYADGRYGDSLYFVKRHLLYLVLGAGAAVLSMSQPLKRIESASRSIMGICLLLLVAVLFPGVGSVVGGARRWIRFLGIGFQPSEFAKLGLIIYLAGLASRRGYALRDLRYGFLPALTAIMVTAGLVLLEPDMGTAVAVGFIGLVVLFSSGIKVKHLAFTVAGALPVLVAAVLYKPYRVRRLLAFMDPWGDARGAGFQVIQSFIALGSGGFYGVGLGESRQKLFYLPESHTDFIFSIIGEELGFLGASSVLILFGTLVWFSMRIAFRSGQMFASRLALGISVMIAFEAIVNIGVSAGMFPTKGLPLPFISYGGSSLVAHMAAIGLLLNISRGEE
ncbi:MAG: putative lipid II flippase FtsW [Candidatus Omnitrophica bacterium]|nr:putative lipid II flippase FtsW [Candidatus Omnitrophota bacterium]